MRRILGVAVAVLVPVACLAASSGAAIKASSGDTCVAAGSGNSFVLSISIPAGAPAQGGFAVGVPESTLTDMTIQANSGTQSKTNLPANTTLAELPSGPLPTGGTLTVNVQTQLSTGIAGPFTVVPASSPSGTWYDPIVCKLASTTAGTPTTAFSVKASTVYHSASGTWTLAVNVPGAGRVNVVQSTTNTGKFVPLIKSAAAHVGGAGAAKIALVPTAAGKTSLKSSNKLQVRLVVTFKPTQGATNTKVVTLTLRKH